ncbi:MAG: zf-HC2 domain-containing protein [Actinomycetota bacterium]
MTRPSRRVRCEEVRELLPEYAEPGPRPAGAVEVHLASCAGCRAELEQYRALLSSLAAYREVEVAVPDGYLEAVMHTARVASYRRLVPSRANLRATTVRVGTAVRRHDTGLRYAAATLGGAAAGATAIALVWWTVGRRPMSGAGAL